MEALFHYSIQAAFGKLLKTDNGVLIWALGGGDAETGDPSCRQHKYQLFEFSP